MLFSSTFFLAAFLPAALIGYHFVFRNIKWKNYFLLIISLLFYAWGEPLYVLLMLGSIATNYFLGLAVDKTAETHTRKFLLCLTVILNLSSLFYFKYFSFIIRNINILFHSDLTVPNISLPIGISFFTFQAMSYVFDVYRKTTEVQKNPLYLALYISFFPQLIAGPIVRYNTIAEQIQSRSVTFEKFESGVCRFIQGFGKKVIISNTLSVTAEHVFSLAADQQLSISLAWIGALAYTFQIFFDFSGYSDMAIGLGRFFGFEFEENFRYPYLSRSVSEFWNRWHISLGQWFRDYVYFPLGGSRVKKLKLVRNLFIVWLLTGIWHGAAWQFILWGLGYGIIITFEKLTNLPKKLKSSTAITLYGIFTFLTVILGWVLFGSYGIQPALYQIGAMFGLHATEAWDLYSIFTLREYGIYFIMAIIFSTPLPKNISERLPKTALYDVCKAISYISILIISVSFLLMGAHNPFIYFNF